MAEESVAIEALGRRRFFKQGLWVLAGAAGLAAGSFTLLRRSELDGLPKPEALTLMSQQIFVLFKRSVEVLLPTQGTALPSPSELPILESINHALATMEPEVREMLLTGLSLFDNAAIVSGFHGKRFVDLSDEEARRYFDDWSEGGSVKRALSSTIKKIVYLAYYRQEPVWGALEYDGPVSDKWGLPSLGNAPLPVEGDV